MTQNPNISDAFMQFLSDFVGYISVNFQQRRNPVFIFEEPLAVFVRNVPQNDPKLFKTTKFPTS